MTVFEIVTTLGIATVLGACIYMGRKLQVLNDLQQTTNKIKINVKVISDYLTSTNVDFNHKELQAYSPLKLTKQGQALIKKLGFDEVFKKYKDNFFQYIDDQDPKLKYDVEKAAIHSIIAIQEMDYMDFLKVYFYNNPDRNITNISPTLGVYLRDKYLEQHPEITE